MASFVARDLSPDTLLPRRKVSGWLAGSGAACWFLLAGPGSGKTCSIKLLVDRLGKSAEWIACGPDMRSQLAGRLALPADTEPAALVEALARTALERHPAGLCLVWDAVERVFDQPAALAILELWLKQAPPACSTFLSSRFPLPFPVTRLVIQGKIRRLGPADLWLDDREVEDWLCAGPRHRALEALLAGWPLGVASLRQLAGQADPDGLLLALAQEEWLGILPPHLREWVDALVPLPALSRASIGQALPGSDPAAILEGLADWGLVAGPGPIRPWHPLVSRQFEAPRAPLDEPLLGWLCDHEPETALAYFQERDDLERSVRLVRRRGIHTIGEQLGPWLARFSAGDRHRSLELAAMDAAYLTARGELTEAIARLRDALERLRPASTGPQIFVALLELLYGYWLTQDFEAFRRVEREADDLADEADFADRVRFWNLKAIIRFDSGAEEEAEGLTRRILAAPHFGQPAIAYIQQMASLNLGVREVSRGQPEAASRQFRRALTLAEEYPHRKGVLFGARLYLATCLLDLGRFEEGERHLRDLETASRGEEGKHRAAVFQSLTGHCHLVLGDLPRAEACFEEALDMLATCGLGESQEAASVLDELAVLHRRRGQIALATHRHARALALAAPWPQLMRAFLLQSAVTKLLAGEAAGARAVLKQLEDLLGEHPAANAGAAARLLRALAAWRSGDRPAAAESLAGALGAIVEGGYFHLFIAYPELAPDLWMLLKHGGHGELLAELESRFPEFAGRVRAQLPAQLAGPPPGDPDLEIRCFGTLEVLVRGKRVEAWPRKRAKALLACLLLAPKGLGREQLFERLFPEPDEADLETRLNLLSSSLRKLLEPDLAPRQKSRYLEIVDKTLRFRTAGVRVDLFEFEEAYRAGMAALEAGGPDRADAAAGPDAAVEAFRRGIDLYTADLFHEPVLMEGFDLERHRARLRVTRMLQISAMRAFERGSYEEARALCERLLEIEPANEEAHRHLMRIYQLFGQEDLLRRQYQLCERLLRQELDLEPSEETRRLGLNLR